MINQVATLAIQFNILIIRRMKLLRRHNDLNRHCREGESERERGRGVERKGVSED